MAVNHRKRQTKKKREGKSDSPDLIRTCCSTARISVKPFVPFIHQVTNLIGHSQLMVTPPCVVYCAFIQASDPASLTATLVKKIRAGLPSAVPRWSVEKSSGPAFLLPAQVVVTLLGFLGPPR
jgi:hypothetical protein